MTNTNCLTGVKCPNCSNEDRFRIQVTTMADVTNDGAEVDHGDMQWDETSYAECAQCCKHGKLSDFKADAESPPGSPPTPELRDTLLDIKRLASKHDDSDACPYTMLELIEQKAIAALAKAKGGAQ